MTPFIIFFIFFAVILIIVLVARNANNTLKKSITDLGGKINNKGEAIFSYQGRDISFVYTPRSKNRAAELKVYTAGNFGAELLIRYETQMDKFFKQIGLNRELQITDRETNDKLYFECDDQEFLNYLFIKTETKTTVFEILKRYTSIEITKTRCLLKKYPAPDEASLTKETILEVAKELFELSRLIPITAGNHPELVSFKTKKLLMYLLGSLALAAGIYLFFWASVSYRVVEAWHLWVASSNVSVIIALVAIALAFFVVRGFSTSSKVLIYFAITFFVGALLVGRYGAAVYNGLHDDSPLRTFDQVVVDKYITTHKSSHTYHVLVKGWHAEMPNWHLTVGSQTYPSVQEGTTKFRIQTKSGRLDFEWIVSQQMLSNEQSYGSQISAANWPNRDYRQWYPLPSQVEGIDPQEMSYWQQWVVIIQEGITNRMNMHDALSIEHPSEFYADLQNEYLRRQQEILDKLTELQPPERLRTFQEELIFAGHEQIDYYKDYVQFKIENPRAVFNADNEHLKTSDRKLWDAYHHFQALYPSRSKDFNDAIERRLAWFDIV